MRPPYFRHVLRKPAASCPKSGYGPTLSKKKMRLRPEGDSEDQPLPRRNALGMAGIASGTPVLTESGWLVVDDLTEGDRVMTFEHGPLPVTSIRSRTFGADKSTYWPNGIVYVPAGALGPGDAYYLLPGQQIMLPSEIAVSMFEDIATLIPAAAMIGIRGICRVMPVDLLEIFEVRLPRESVIETAGGTWLRCPGVSARVRSSPLRRRRVFAQAGLA